MEHVTSQTPHDLERSVEHERALNRLLRTIVERRPLPDILGECLDIILGLSWLPLCPRAGFFLADEDNQTLHLTATRNFSPELLTRCARVPFGHCLCGQAAQTRQVLHAGHVDDRHVIRFDGMPDHGHYNVPIVDGDRVLGVLVLYLDSGRQRHEAEAGFLTAVADMLALVIRQKRSEQALERAVQRLEYQAHVDDLTGLYNRRFLMERLQEAVELAQRNHRDLALLSLDVDWFKQVNDRHGHGVGDQVLAAIGAHLNSFTRRYDIAARAGGEEFFVLLPDTDADTATEIAERIRGDLERRAVIRDPEVTITISVGIAVLDTGDPTESLLRRADDALYAVKQAGRNRVRLAAGDADG